MMHQSLALNPPDRRKPRAAEMFSARPEFLFAGKSTQKQA